MNMITLVNRSVQLVISMAILFDLHSGWLLVILPYTDPVGLRFCTGLLQLRRLEPRHSSRLQRKWANNSHDKSDLME
jgi:hypothetical protein